ncbi:MAG: hypothetical protein QMD12_01460, partial [Candidatus Aenigmarchaeota archaeon]|nr:hypothetical protein [Candidatus Aenigmarchaeota archaeon]
MANFKYLLIVIILLLSLNIAEAQVPRLISVQGRLLDSSDQPITTTVSIVFRIFDDYTIGAPDNELWSETRSITPDSYGVFNVILGGVSPLNINFNIPTYLQVEVEGEVLSPRYNITALPYGFRGVVAENLSSSGRIYIQPENTLPGSYFYGSGSAQGLVLTDNLIVSGNVGIGTTSADQKLSVVGNIGLSGGNRFIGTIDNYALSLRTSNSDRLWITSDGNVGIGTTSPGAKLDIAGNIRWSGTLIGGSVPWARLTSFPSACPSGQYVTAVGSSLTCSTPPGGVGGSGTTNYLAKWTAETTLGNSIIYDNGTNVGIGTSIPGYKLDVQGGDINVSGVYRRGGVAGASITCGAGNTPSGITISGGIVTSAGSCTPIGAGISWPLLAPDGSAAAP